MLLGPGGFERAVKARALGELVAALPAVEVVGVDIPIGLLAGERRADREARRVVGARRNSVFRTPPRPVAMASSYEEANIRCRELVGQGISQQAWALVPKILEAERYRAAGGVGLFEVHPEVSWWAMAGSQLRASKHTWNGLAHRRVLLGRQGIELPDDLGEAGKVAADDVLDAAAAAWSARRIATGEAHCLPDPPERDDAGCPVAIWY